MRHFLLARELPAIFTLCLAGGLSALTARTSDLPPADAAPLRLLGLWLLVAALWTFLLWLILLLPLLRRRSPHWSQAHARPQPDERQHAHHKQQRQKRCGAA